MISATSYIMAVLRSLTDEDESLILSNRVYHIYPKSSAPLTPFAVTSLISSVTETVSEGEEITRIESVAVDIYHARVSTAMDVTAAVTSALLSHNISRTGGVEQYIAETELYRISSTYTVHSDKWGNIYSE